MNDEKPLLSAAIRHLADRQRRTLTEHPTSGELTAYHAGELPSEAEARLREHLALCRDCSDLLLDLAGFATLAPPPGVPELSDDEVEHDWQALRARMGQERPSTVVPIRRVMPARPKRELSPWKVLAAASLAAVVGLSAWVALRPSPGGPVVVFDEGEQVRGGAEERLQHMSSSQHGVFRFYSQQSYDSYQGEIAEDGKVVWKTEFKADQLPAPPDSEIRPVPFLVPGGSLKPGRYEARLFGMSDGRRDLLGHLGFEVDGR